jgi:predicted metal-binding membrane protein
LSTPFLSRGTTEDTPRAALRLLSWRINLAVVVAIVALSVLAWRGTVAQSLSMSGMVMGLGQIGSRSQGDMSLVPFLSMWATMMVAMMLPTTVPIVLAHLAVTRRRGAGISATLLFVAGYLGVWCATGLLPFLAYKAFAQLSDEAAQSLWLPPLAGAILIVAGAYQFTGWKKICFNKCQSPFAFIVSHRFGAGAVYSLQAGAIHALYCLGCCWALTVVLLVVGLMNLFWMTGIFILFFIEKSWKHGLTLARIAGAALMVLGACVIAWPALLSLISA